MNAVATTERLPTIAPAALSPMDRMVALTQAGITPDQLRDFLAVQQEWEANEARKAYVQAMAEFKANPPEIVKDKLVSFGQTKYSHATLGNVCEAIVQGLAMHGFSHRWDIAQGDKTTTVTCVITHKLGHSETTVMTAAPDSSGQKNAIQQIASAITYLQRYTLLSATGLATKDQTDDDGRGTSAADPAAALREEAQRQDWIDKIREAGDLVTLANLNSEIAAAHLPSATAKVVREIFFARKAELKKAGA